MSEDTQNTSCSRSAHRRVRFWRFFSLSILVVAIGAFVVPAIAGGFGGHCGRGGHADWSEEELTEHAQHMSAFVLDELDGTEEQQAQFDAIIARVVPDAVALHGEARALTQELRAAFQAETIDTAAVETARAQLVDVVDRGSRLLTDTLLEASSVLTPEQRETLSTWIEEWHD
jgi:Spy/CpxP family protein refolding chaperone